jgi:hypothetical protein
MAIEKKTKVISPLTGKEADAVIIDIEESTERWSEIVLSDGARLRLKQVIIEVARIEGQFDANGNPLYLVQSAPIMAIGSIPPDLLKKG